MARLIDVMRIDLDDVDISDCTDVDDIFAKIEDLLDAQPIVDAVPVVHGRWLKTRESVGWGEFDCVECSNCHQTWIMGEDYEFDDFGYWKFCPNCGAKMDGDGNG